MHVPQPPEVDNATRATPQPRNTFEEPVPTEPTGTGSKGADKVQYVPLATVMDAISALRANMEATVMSAIDTLRANMEDRLQKQEEMFRAELGLIRQQTATILTLVRPSQEPWSEKLQVLFGFGLFFVLFMVKSIVYVFYTNECNV